MSLATTGFLAVGYLIVLSVLVPFRIADAENSSFEYTASERAMIVAHGPWPPAWKPDLSNRGSGNKNAIALGARLFVDMRLSLGSRFSCVSCHQLRRMFTDGQKTNTQQHILDRNTPTVINLRWNRWFGWDGSSDSLWAQSIRPILSEREMQVTLQHVATLVAEDESLSCGFGMAYGIEPSTLGHQDILVLVAKALAAYQETLVSGRSAFDKFRDALVSGDFKSAIDYPIEAQRGLKIFAGRGRCSLCHFGPHFTNGEFGDVGIPFFIARGVVDKGRFGGLLALKNSPYNLVGRFNDDPTRSTATSTTHVSVQHRNWGEFKIPSLRNVALTAPYMHNGSLPTLEAVVRHYSELDEERLHTDGEKILQPLNLNEFEITDLVAFLKSLSAPVDLNNHQNTQLNGECRS